MDWKELFTHCWNNSLEAQIQPRCYVIHPDKLDTLDRVELYDKSAARMIEEMEGYIEALKGYRQALAERYSQLVTMPYTLHLELVRHKGYFDKRVTYTLRLYRLYEDGHQQDEEKTTYAGTQRRQAMEDFETEKKKRPGIPAVLDIGKKSWEK